MLSEKTVWLMISIVLALAAIGMAGQRWWSTSELRYRWNHRRWKRRRWQREECPHLRNQPVDRVS